jgi:hypothetical protein
MWLLIANDQVRKEMLGSTCSDQIHAYRSIVPPAGGGRPGPTGVAPVPVPVGISRCDGRYGTRGGSIGLDRGESLLLEQL